MFSMSHEIFDLLWLCYLYNIQFYFELSFVLNRLYTYIFIDDYDK